jgi:hypothetical protein
MSVYSRIVFFGQLVVCFFLFQVGVHAQIFEPGGGQIHGNVGIDAQYYTRDTLIGSPPVPEKFRMNAFMNLVYTNGNFYAGARYEAYLPGPLLGFDPRFEGQGIPFRYAGYKTDKIDVTAGNFYEQFGNGLILRSYEERALGFDNALDGFRVKYSPVKGLTLTGLAGTMRYFFTSSEGILKGFDGELNFNDLMQEKEWKKLRLVIGGSFVSRYQRDQEIPNPDNPSQLLEIPLNVGAFSGRMNMGYGKFRMNAEYARKINDPNLTNEFIYREGSAAYLSASYSTKGLGITFQAKRVENMDFRADRNETGNAVLVNFIPMLNKQHTYALPGTIYPYAVQNNGELGVQFDLNYTTGKWFRKKYPTQINLNFSSVNALDTTLTGDRQGYTSTAFGLGKGLYYDGNIEISQRLSKKLKLNLMYMYLWVDRNLVQGLGISPREIGNHIGVADLSWKLSKKYSLRFEAQGLYTPQEMDQLGDRINGSWLMGLVELTVSPNFFVSIIDQYAIGNPVEDFRIHYLTGAAGYTFGTTRLMLSYGRQREGIVCIGGVCRTMPAANGLTFSLMTSF